MKHYAKKITATAAGIATALALSGCAQLLPSLDIVGQQSVISFNEMLLAMPDQVRNGDSGTGWSLDAPDDAVRFNWGAASSDASQVYLQLEIDAAPFIAAGMDPAKLPDSHTYMTSGSDGEEMLLIGTTLTGDETLTTSTPKAFFEQLVRDHRDVVNFHTSLDHYGVKLGGGNMFEWARDLVVNRFDNSVQDKDIVFVLNPEPFIAAGADPENIEGWVYAEVTVEENGKPIEVWKLLKPFDVVS